MTSPHERSEIVDLLTGTPCTKKILAQIHAHQNLMGKDFGRGIEKLLFFNENHLGAFVEMINSKKG